MHKKKKAKWKRNSKLFTHITNRCDIHKKEKQTFIQIIWKEKKIQADYQNDGHYASNKVYNLYI